MLTVRSNNILPLVGGSSKALQQALQQSCNRHCNRVATGTATGTATEANASGPQKQYPAYGGWQQ